MPQRNERGFTPKQELFFDALKQSGNVKIAKELAGLSINIHKYWMANEEAFVQEESRILAERNPILLLLDPEKRKSLQSEDMTQVVRQEQAKHVFLVRLAFSRLSDILQNGSDTQALKAAEMVGKWYGISPELFAPGHLTMVQQNLIQMFSGGKENVEPDDYDSEGTLDASFREMPADLDTLHSEGCDEL